MMIITKKDDEPKAGDDEEISDSPNSEYEKDNVLDYTSEDDENKTESKSNQTEKSDVSNPDESSDCSQKNDITLNDDKKGIGDKSKDKSG